MNHLSRTASLIILVLFCIRPVWADYLKVLKSVDTSIGNLTYGGSIYSNPIQIVDANCADNPLMCKVYAADGMSQARPAVSGTQILSPNFKSTWHGLSANYDKIIFDIPTMSFTPTLVTNIGRVDLDNAGMSVANSFYVHYTAAAQDTNTKPMNLQVFNTTLRMAYGVPSATEQANPNDGTLSKYVVAANNVASVIIVPPTQRTDGSAFEDIEIKKYQVLIEKLDPTTGAVVNQATIDQAPFWNYNTLINGTFGAGTYRFTVNTIDHLLRSSVGTATTVDLPGAVIAAPTGVTGTYSYTSFTNNLLVKWLQPTKSISGGSIGTNQIGRYEVSLTLNGVTSVYGFDNVSTSTDYPIVLPNGAAATLRAVGGYTPSAKFIGITNGIYGIRVRPFYGQSPFTQAGTASALISTNTACKTVYGQYRCPTAEQADRILTASASVRAVKTSYSTVTKLGTARVTWLSPTKTISGRVISPDEISRYKVRMVVPYGASSVVYNLYIPGTVNNSATTVTLPNGRKMTYYTTLVYANGRYSVALYLSKLIYGGYGFIVYGLQKGQADTDEVVGVNSARVSFLMGP